ncbi:HTH_Tnp_Tc3_2 domain-containing protein [Trichonephila clavipes]|nr:HTH_Tnp_Tc3_2 domain-containing protein [Trichonephila clavipes]
MTCLPQLLLCKRFSSLKQALVTGFIHHGEDEAKHLLPAVLKRVRERPGHRDENCKLVDAPCCWPVTRETTRRDDQRIVRQALVDPTVTRSTIRADVGLAIVPQTISRHLAKANLKSKRPFRALSLTPEHRQLRRQCCQARSMRIVTNWQKVVFNDEFQLFWGQMITVYGCGGALVIGTNPPTLFYVTLPAQLV